ncbi:MAG: ATP-binding protein [Actinomycetota bacterium]
MRIVELSLRNYRVFEEVDLELPARVIGIFGPNGAGKSTLVEAIQFGCYGRARTHKSQIRTDGILTDCAVRLVFEHGGRQYEVRRTIRGKNNQTDAELYVGDRQLAAGVTEVEQEIQRLLRMDVHVFRASVFAEQKQLDAFSEVTKGKRKEMVLRLLGIRPVDEARTAARKEARETKGNADRLAGSLPDASEQEAELTKARAAAVAAEGRATEAAVALAEAEGRNREAEQAFETSNRTREQVDRLRVERKGLSGRAEELEARRTSLRERIEAGERELGALPALEQEHAALARAPALLAAGERASEVATELAGVEGELAGLPEVDAGAALAGLEKAGKEARAAERAHTQAESAHERATADLAAAQESLDRAAEADPSAPCPTCGRPLGEDFEQYVAHCREAVRERKRAEVQAASGLKRAVASLRAVGKREADATRAGEEARAGAEARGRLSARLEALRERLRLATGDFDGRVPDVAVLRADAERSGELKDRLAGLRTEARHLATSRTDLDQVVTDLNETRSRLGELDREEAALGFEPEEHQRLAKERSEAARLLERVRREERRASDEAKAAGTAVRELEAQIRKVEEIRGTVGELLDDARYLDRVATLLEGFRTHLYARIIPELSREAEALFRDLTNREYEDLRIDPDTLAIEIADGERYFPIERFSGSESDLANLALRVAISTHLSRMSGADIGMLVLDEVLGSLDVERKDLFVQSMGRLATRFHQLFVITHAEQVKDQFPASIEVGRVGRRRSQAALV